VTAYPEITKMKLTKDIEFIMLACDGVWDCVDIQKLFEHISIKLKSRKPISEITGELFDQLIAKVNNSISSLTLLAPIGTDNMSCIIIQFIHDIDDVDE
jgi:protein phosphatase 2C family protein 2/3